MPGPVNPIAQYYYDKHYKDDKNIDALDVEYTLSTDTKAYGRMISEYYSDKVQPSGKSFADFQKEFESEHGNPFDKKKSISSTGTPSNSGLSKSSSVAPTTTSQPAPAANEQMGTLDDLKNINPDPNANAENKKYLDALTKDTEEIDAAHQKQIAILDERKAAGDIDQWHYDQAIKDLDASMKDRKRQNAKYFTALSDPANLNTESKKYIEERLGTPDPAKVRIQTIGNEVYADFQSTLKDAETNIRNLAKTMAPRTGKTEQQLLDEFQKQGQEFAKGQQDVAGKQLITDADVNKGYLGLYSNSALNTTRGLVDDLLAKRDDMSDYEKSAVRSYVLNQIEAQPILEEAKRRTSVTATKIGLMESPAQLVDRFSKEMENLNAKYGEIAGNIKGEAATVKQMFDQKQAEADQKVLEENAQIEQLRAQFKAGIEAGTMDPMTAENIIKTRVDNFNTQGKQAFNERQAEQSRVMRSILKKAEQQRDLYTGEMKAAMAKYHIEGGDANKKLELNTEYVRKYNDLFMSHVTDLYNEKQAVQNEEYNKLSYTQKLQNAVNGGVIDLFSSVGGTLGYLGFHDARNMIMDYTSQQEAMMPIKEFDDFTMSTLLDPDWLISKAGRSVVTSLPLMATGAGVSSLIGRGLAATTLSATSRSVITSLGGGIAMRSIESAMESAGTFNKAIADGDSEEEAYRKANYVMKSNMALFALDAIELHAIFGGVPTRVISATRPNRFIRVAKSVGNTGLVVASNAGEEFAQTYFQEKADNPLLLFTEYMQSPLAKEVSALGGITGLGFSAAGRVLNGTPQGQLASINNMLHDYVNSFPQGQSEEVLARRHQQMIDTLALLSGRGTLTTQEYNEAVSIIDTAFNTSQNIANGSLPFTMNSEGHNAYAAQVLERTRLQNSLSNFEEGTEEYRNIQAQINDTNKAIGVLLNGEDNGQPRYTVDGASYSREDISNMLDNPDMAAALAQSNVVISNDEELLNRFNATVENNKMLAQQSISIMEELDTNNIADSIVLLNERIAQAQEFINQNSEDGSPEMANAVDTLNKSKAQLDMLQRAQKQQPQDFPREEDVMQQINTAPAPVDVNTMDPVSTPATVPAEVVEPAARRRASNIVESPTGPSVTELPPNPNVVTQEATPVAPQETVVPVAEEQVTPPVAETPVEIPASEVVQEAPEPTVNELPPNPNIVPQEEISPVTEQINEPAATEQPATRITQEANDRLRSMGISAEDMAMLEGMDQTVVDEINSYASVPNEPAYNIALKQAVGEMIRTGVVAAEEEMMAEEEAPKPKKRRGKEKATVEPVGETPQQTTERRANSIELPVAPLETVDGFYVPLERLKNDFKAARDFLAKTIKAQFIPSARDLSSDALRAKFQQGVINEAIKEWNKRYGDTAIFQTVAQSAKEFEAIRGQVQEAINDGSYATAIRNGEISADQVRELTSHYFTEPTNELSELLLQEEGSPVTNTSDVTIPEASEGVAEEPTPNPEDFNMDDVVRNGFRIPGQEHVVAFFKKWMVKYLSTTKGLGKKLFNITSKAEYQLQRALKEGAFLAQRMRLEIRSLPEAQRIAVSKILNEFFTYKDAVVRSYLLHQLPAEMRPYAVAMRASVDSLSQQMIDAGLIDEKLMLTFQNNMGAYLYRQYERDVNPKWTEKAKANTALWNKAKAWFQSSFTAELEARTTAVEALEARIEYLRNLDPNAFDMTVDEDMTDQQKEDYVKSLEKQLDEARKQMRDSRSVPVNSNDDYMQSLGVTAELEVAYNSIAEELVRVNNGDFSNAKNFAKKVFNPAAIAESIARMEKAIAFNQGLVDNLTHILENLEAYMESRTKSRSNNQNQSGREAGPFAEMDLTIFKRRKNIPADVREFWGEIDDPLFNFLASQAKMAKSLAHFEMQVNMRKEGLGSVFFDQPTETPDGVKHIIEFKYDPAMQGLFKGPNEPLYVSEDMYDTLKNMYSMPSNSWVTRAFRWANGRVNSMLIAWSYKTQIGNYLNNPAMLLRQGIVGGFKFFKEGQTTIMADFWRKTTAEQEAKILEWMEYGIIQGGVGSGGLKAILNQFKSDEDALMSQYNQTRFQAGLERAENAPNELYAAGDYIWKAVMFEAEKSNYAKILYGKSFEQLTKDEQNAVRERASMIVLATMPDYARVVMIGKKVNEFPLIGQIGMAYVSEQWRTTVNTYQLAAQEIREGKADGNTRLTARGFARLAGMTTMVALPTVLSAYAFASMGFSMRDRKLYNELVPVWDQTTDLIPMPTKDGNINYWTMRNFDPMKSLKEPIYAAYFAGSKRDANFSGGIFSGMLKTVEPFLGENTTARLALQWITGEKLDGTGAAMYNKNKPIFNLETIPDILRNKLSAEERFNSSIFADFVNQVSKYLLPKSIEDLKNIYRGYKGARREDGRVYEFQQELAGTFFGRTTTLNVGQTFKYRMVEFKNELASSIAIYSKEKRKPINAEDDVTRANESSKVAVEQVLKKYARITEAAVRFSDLATVKDVLSNMAISRDMQNILLSGEDVSIEDIDVAYERATKKFKTNQPIE